MNTSSRSADRADCRAFTMVELSVVIVTLLILAAAILPRLAKGKDHDWARIRCVNNLKDVGLALRIFATDNEGAYPWQLSVTNGGTMELAGDPTSLVRQFAVLSNELSTPRILACPSDQRSQEATNFATLASNNLSYFLGLDTSDKVPQSVQSGDRNLTLSGVDLSPGPVRLKPGGTNGFSAGLHKNAGNLLFGDGSVQQVTSGQAHSAFQSALNASMNQSLRLLIP